MAPNKQHAHQLLDQLDMSQLAAVVQLLEVMTDPVARSLANAPIDDEPEDAQEHQAVAESRDWLKKNGGKGVPHDEAMRRLGLK